MSAKQSQEMRDALALVAGGKTTVANAALLSGVQRTSLHRALKIEREKAKKKSPRKRA